MMHILILTTALEFLEWKQTNSLGKSSDLHIKCILEGIFLVNG